MQPQPPLAADKVDWTALHNFAALRGQLRVSFTPRCNIACWFCHNEGDVPPPLTRQDRSQQPRPAQLNADAYLALMQALMDAGLKRVYFTGGEPLTSPIARPVLEGLPEPGPDASYTLITNGTRLRTHRLWLARTHLDKVKVSLHYFSDESLRAIAGTRIGIGTVLDGIETAREIFERVELNTLLQRENAHEVRQILDYALERRLPVQFIELVGTDFNESRAASAVPADAIIAHLRTLTDDERIEVTGVGQGRRVFRVDGVEIDVIHRDLGRHHVGQCGTCPVRAKCVEGFWALRIDHGGGVQPCLLRDDLRLDVRDLIAEPARLAQAVAGRVAAFTEGTL
ncbi:cyclic pyranopterin phosphate synthase [Streptomyces sp. DvalAA-14]|uniref:radical SAM protein n=1 Tax=unclassified Streptomyces TaxID=2593676 RepID=UPI00081B5F01|nr:MULTISPECIES: radical SAM protein [unclassified Streptomyces]MYS22827.1 radical SAM protein [Streptomyces sp. SID4948]SCE22913.1 cyclic pyranopterin phosphate synthase [Streptomyces sp. DvalAA-14]